MNLQEAAQQIIIFHQEIAGLKKREQGMQRRLMQLEIRVKELEDRKPGRPRKANGEKVDIAA